MWKLTGLWLLLLAALNVAVTEGKDEYFVDGGNITLTLMPAIPSPKNILWKFKNNLLAEWVKDVVPLNFYAPFNGRTTLDTDTGLLTIDRMTEADEGVYSVLIDDKIQSESYRAIMIEKVTKPQVVVRTLTCTPESESCNVSCVADTGKAEPVDYRWETGDGKWKKTENDIITKARDAQVKTLTCWIKNSVSEEGSDPITNPLYRELRSDSGAIAGGIVGTLVILGVVGLVFLAWKKEMGPFRNRGINTESTRENGQPAAAAPPPSDNSTQPPENVPLNSNPDDKEAQ